MAEELSDYDMQLFENGMGPSQMRAEIEAGKCLLARKNLELIGYALTRQQGPLVDITRLAVLPNYQGKGLGRDILRAVFAQHQVPQFMLNVRKDNRRAIELYKSEGFRIEGVVGDSWLMLRTSGR